MALRFFQQLFASKEKLVIDYPMTDEFVDAHPDVVGESRYQDNLKSIAGEKTVEGVEISVDAYLIPEPANKYDANAIRVEVSGKTVGYINRKSAKSICSALSNMQPQPRALRLDAFIVGGWDRGNGDIGHFGVKFTNF